MIAHLIEEDHIAGREVFSVVGNATQPAWDERGDEMRGLAALWQAHGVMLERAVLPRLRSASEGPELSRRLMALHHEVAGLAADLAVRAPGHDAEHRWLADFERLKAAFDAQCDLEEVRLVPLIRRVASPDDIARMTRDARSLRAPSP